MKKQIFEKVIEEDGDYRYYAIAIPLGVLFLSIVYLFYYDFPERWAFLLIGLIFGVALSLSIYFLIQYEKSRKVYWRRIK